MNRRFMPPIFPVWNFNQNFDSLLPDLNKTFNVSNINNALLDAQRVFKDIEAVFLDNSSSYPPRNLIKTPDGYILELATAGFKRDELKVEIDTNNVLIISGKKVKDEDDIKEDKQCIKYLTKSIATRQFRIKLQMCDNDEVIKIKYEDGILQILINKKIQEEPKIKQLAIE